MTIPLFVPVVALMAAPAEDAQALPIAAAQTAPAPELSEPLLDPAIAAPETMPTPRHAKGDPLEGFNRAMFDVHQELDKALYRPAAMGYKTIVPKPVRSGLRNFFSNLGEPIVFFNYLLQFRPGRAARTLARFGINSTIGIGGLIDVAKTKDFKLPHVANSFGDTLAYHGVGPGPYLFIPFLGPTTLRDGLGTPVDGAVLPVAVGTPFDRWEYQVASGAITGLDRRAEADAELRALFDGAVDPYATLRSVFLQNRAAEVETLRHHKPAPELNDPLSDPDAPELSDPLDDPAATPD